MKTSEYYHTAHEISNALKTTLTAPILYSSHNDILV